MPKTLLTDKMLGKFAKLNRGYYSGIIGRIEENKQFKKVSDYVLVTKAGGISIIRFEEDVTLVDVHEHV